VRQLVVARRWASCALLFVCVVLFGVFSSFIASASGAGNGGFFVLSHEQGTMVPGSSSPVRVVPQNMGAQVLGILQGSPGDDSALFAPFQSQGIAEVSFSDLPTLKYGRASSRDSPGIPR